MIDSNSIKLKAISDVNDIHTNLIRLSKYLYNQKLNNSDMLYSLAYKYSRYAKVVIANVLDEPKGLCAFYINKETKIAFISMIVVAKNVQGKGIGSTLLNNVLEQCISNGMKQIRLEVVNSNVNAIHFYIKHGFKIEKKMNDTSYYRYRI